MIKQKALFIFLFTLILISCQTIKKSFENRDYDRVVSLFLQKKKVSEEEISYFEKAYNVALERDKEQIVLLKSANSGNRWEEIFNLYSKINTRQNNVLRVLPLYYSDGRKASIETFDFSAVLEESRQNAAQAYYDQGLKLLNSKNKNSIRQSLDYFAASKKFYINYKDVNELMEEAQIKGKNYALLLVEKNPNLMVPSYFEQSILENIKLTKNAEWLSIDYRRKDAINYDFLVKLNLYDIQVSPDALKEIYTTEEKSIQDGWQYELDNKGNVKKDSLGNDIKKPKYVKITCQVKETRMEKSTRVLGDVTIYDATTKDYLKNQKCIGNAIFNYSYFQINGNKDALSANTISKLKYLPAPFPNTLDMVEQCKAELIRCYQDFITANYNAMVYVK
ncbi:MAG: hypothetical protein RJA25_713 [Bacteroidota bacterium]